jgi:hypothetical protein
MSLWRRAPRQVYCVYGEEEYLSEENAVGETELPLQTMGSGSFEKGPAIGAAVPPHAGSRTYRLIGVGLLLGVTFGAGVLFVSYLTRETPRSRGGTSSASASHRLQPTSSGPLPRGASGANGADPDAQRRSGRIPASRTSSFGHPSSGFVATRREPGSAVTQLSRSAGTTAARRAGANPSVAVAASTVSEASATSAGAGDEFEFER